MKISIVTIVREDPSGLADTINCLRRQLSAKIDFVVINGGGDDATHQVAINNLDFINQYVRERDAGVSDAFNKSQPLVSGDTVLFLNAGDVLVEDDTLSECSKIMKAHEEVVRTAVFYGNYYRMGANMRRLVVADPVRLRTHNSLNHQSCFVGADLFQSHKYDVRLRISMDYDYWLRLLNCGVQFIPLSIPVAYFQEGGLSSSAKYMAYNIMTKEVCRVLNAPVKTYSFKRLTQFYLRAVCVLTKTEIKEWIGTRVLHKYRRLRTALGFR